jgi:hypothetical protein
VLNFGRASFAWNKMKSIKLEGDRKLTIIFVEEVKHKKRTCDLKGLSEKEDFISALRQNCASSEIQ